MEATHAAKNKRLPLIIILASVAAVIAIAVSVLFIADPFWWFGRKAAVNKYVRFSVLREYSGNLEDYIPEEQIDTDGMELSSEDAEELANRCEERYEETFGDDWKLTFEIEEEKRWSESKVKKVAKALKDQYGIDKDAVKEVYEIELSISLSGSDDSEEEERKVLAVNLDGKWYVTDNYDDTDDYFVSFYY